MFLLGLFLPVCFLAGLTGTAIPTQWPVLLIFLAVTFWQRRGRLSWLWVAFLGYAGLSMLWSPDFGFAVLVTCVWGLAFWYGAVSDDLTHLWQGLALGISINSVVAVLQQLGVNVFYSAGDIHPGGLLFNSTLLGACSALVLIAMVCRREWYFIPGILPALWLAHSRGAWIIAVFGLVARYVHWAIAAGIIIVGCAAFILIPDPSNLRRIEFWAVAVHYLTVFGNGAGAFNSVYLAQGNTLTHAEYIHNDYLELVYSYGIIGLAPIGVLAAALRKTDAVDWSALVGFAALGLFYFPMETPIPAFIGCVVAGHLLRGSDPVGDLRRRWRSYFLSRELNQECLAHSVGNYYFPDVAGNMEP